MLYSKSDKMNDTEGKKCSQHYIEEMLGMEEEDEDLGVSEVTQFYKGLNVFITGASGFFGKLLIEKLLRCTNVKKIYLMVRQKKGKSPEERLEAQFNDVLYDRLRRERPNFLQRIVCMFGDVSAPDLGISAEDREILKENVHIIYHMAANVRFNEKIRKALETNVRGTKLILDLAKEVKNLKAVIHVSTAFSHCTFKFIEEKFYAPQIEADKLLELLDILDDEALLQCTPALVGKYPNTYAFSKGIAEDMVQKHGKTIPICVVRPSMVMPTFEEPIPGWIDNLYGPTGVSIGVSAGLIRTMLCTPNKVADMIPADVVINNIVVAAWNTAVTWQEKQQKLGWEIVPRQEEMEDPVIYNCVSSVQNPITWECFMKENFEFGVRVPPIKIMWYAVLFLFKDEWKYNVSRVFLHTIPGLIVDLLLRLTGRKPMLSDAYRKIHQFSDVIKYFSTQQWKFTNDQVIKLWDKLTPIDKQLYDFNIKNYEWDMYHPRHYLGLRVFLIKDPLSTGKDGVKRYNKFRIAHYFLLTVMGSGLAYCAFNIVYWIISLVISFFVFLWNRY